MLFTNIELPNGIELKNRIMKAALNEALADKNYDVTENHIELYRKWANGGVGLIVSGNVMVNRNHRSEPGNVVLDNKTNTIMLKN